MASVPKKRKQMQNNVKVQTDQGSPAVAQIQTGEASMCQNEVTYVKMSSLVFSILVKNTRDVRVLKTYRIVSKSSNEEACPALRTHSIVRLEESNPDRLKKFMNLLLEGRFFGLPSPFQNFHVEASTVSDDTFTTLINLQKLIIIRFSVTIRDIKQLNRRMFETVYEDNRATIREFSFEETENGDVTTLLFKKNKQLELEDSCFPNCFHKEVFLKVFNHVSNFEQIKLRIEHPDTLIQVLTLDRQGHVRDLDLQFDREMGRDAWKVLESCVMPKLKVLRINFDEDEAGLYYQELISLLKNVATTIEDLQMNFVTMTGFPVLPKLRCISFYDWKDELCNFSPSMFPSLKSVSLHVSDPIQRFLPVSGFKPHDKVEVVMLNLDSSEDNPVVRNLHVLMDYLKRQFPSVNCFHLDEIPQAIDAFTFLAIHNAFPELKEICLDGLCDFASMCGTSIDIITDYLANGLTVEDIPRKCCILSFPKLEVLLLTASVVVTNDMVIYCLSKIPSLRTLSFRWNGELSVNEVRDCLGHLQNINIRVVAEIQDLKDKFWESMPNVVADVRL